MMQPQHRVNRAFCSHSRPTIPCFYVLRALPVRMKFPLQFQLLEESVTLASPLKKPPPVSGLKTVKCSALPTASHRHGFNTWCLV